MERVSTLFLVILVAFSHLIICSGAVSSTSVQRFQQESGVLPDPSQIPQVGTKGGMMEEMMNGRMDLETSDYPGSGANNRHTPEPPAKN